MKKYRVKGTGEIVTVIPATSENAKKIVEWLNCDLYAGAIIKNAYPSKDTFIFYQRNGVDIQVLLDCGYYFHFSHNGDAQVSSNEKLDDYEDLEDNEGQTTDGGPEQPIIFRKEGDVFGICIPSLDITSFGDSWEEAKDGVIATLEYILDGSLRNYQDGGKSDEGVRDFLRIYKDFIEAIEKKYKEPAPSKIKADISVSPEALKEIEKRIEEKIEKTIKEVGDILDDSVKVKGSFEADLLTKEESEPKKDSSPYVRHYKNSLTGKYVQVIEVTTGNIDVLTDKIDGMLKEGGFVSQDKTKKELRVCLCSDAHITHLAIDKGIFLHFEGGEIGIEYFPSLPGYEYNPMPQKTAEGLLGNIAKTHQNHYGIYGNLVKLADTSKGILTAEKPHEKLGITEKQYDTLFKALTKTANEEIAKMKAAKIKHGKSLGQLVDEYMASGSKSDEQKKLESIKKVVDSTLEDYYW